MFRIFIFLVFLQLIPRQGTTAEGNIFQDVFHSKGMALKYMGSFSHPTTFTHTSQERPKRETGIYSTSYYFKSQNAAGWSTAKEDCKNFLGEDATLLTIESDEELMKVKEFLSSDDTGSTYWVGAGYDISSGEFRWESGVELDSTAESWDEGYPDTRTPLTKVFAFTVGDLKLRTRFSTVSLRYMCELQVGSSTQSPPSSSTTIFTTTLETSTTSEESITPSSSTTESDPPTTDDLTTTTENDSPTTTESGESDAPSDTTEIEESDPSWTTKIEETENSPEPTEQDRVISSGTVFTSKNNLLQNILYLQFLRNATNLIIPK